MEADWRGRTRALVSASRILRGQPIPAQMRTKIRKTDRALNRLVGLEVEVLWDEGNGDVWRGWHTLRRVCRKTLVFDNGGENTVFRARREHAAEIFSRNNSNP